MLTVLPCRRQVGSFGGLVDEVEGLKRDKNVLMLELVRLRQQQQVRSEGAGPRWQGCWLSA